MNKKAFSSVVLSLTSLLLLGGCSCSSSSKSSSQHSSTSSSKTSKSDSRSSAPSYTSQEVETYMNKLAETSVANHLYVHYYRFAKTVDDYDQWDIWAWPYRPVEGQGHRFDWQGRTTSSSRLDATGNATIDSLGMVTCDIDLTKTYDAGWNNTTQTMGGTPMTFYSDNSKTTLEEKIGIQLVKSQTRKSNSGFWTNDGGNLYVELNTYALTNKDESKSFHVFLVQDYVQTPKTRPEVGEIVDPFEGDDGTNVTYGNASYADCDFKDKAKAATAQSFLKGNGKAEGTDGEKTILANGAGVGYQIMVSSFADSDGDGWGDIYGIEQKLPYLKQLGVNVLWLTPVQLSDSYHGYDIADYLKVDPRYGSKTSPASVSAGRVDSDTAKADYQSLIKHAHDLGMAVIMDLVLNHTSNTNNWFISSAQLEDDYRGFYQWGNHDTQQENINEGKYWYPYGSHVYSYYAKFGSSMPELNYAYVGTRQAVETMAKNWCEFGVDGFRMDAVKHIFLKDEVAYNANDTYISDVSVNATTGKTQDYSSDLTKNLNFWKELNATVKEDYPNAFFVGENFDGHAYHVAPFYEGFDSLFDFYSYFNLTSVASSSFRNGSTGAYTAWLSTFLGAYIPMTKQDDIYSPDRDTNLEGNKSKSVKFGGGWDLADIMSANNQYRSAKSAKPNDTNGFEAMNGAFTSNHDIARCINRIAGNNYSLSGLEEQGEVTAGNLAELDTLATLVECTELMLPGCTWIYYGDELGMTGNLEGKKSTDGYADLVYRQPMKWKQGGVKGDGSMTTSYEISGGTSVKWDNINSSELIKDAETQVNDPKSHYSAISAFANAKGSSNTLVRGNYKATALGEGQYATLITRTLGNDKYYFAVNMGKSSVSVSGVSGLTSLAGRSCVLVHNGEIIASFGGTNIPEVSKYTLNIGDQHIDTTKNNSPLDPSFEEYMALGVTCKVGDKLTITDNTTSVTFKINNLDGASKGFKYENGEIICITAGTYDFYLKFKMNADQVYIGLH